MREMASWVTSMPIHSRPSFSAASMVVPQPQNGSSTTSPGLLLAWMPTFMVACQTFSVTNPKQLVGRQSLPGEFGRVTECGRVFAARHSANLHYSWCKQRGDSQDHPCRLWICPKCGPLSGEPYGWDETGLCPLQPTRTSDKYNRYAPKHRL